MFHIEMLTKWFQLKDNTLANSMAKFIFWGYKLDYYFDSKIDLDLGFSVAESLSYNMIITCFILISIS